MSGESLTSSAQEPCGPHVRDGWEERGHRTEYTIPMPRQQLPDRRIGCVLFMREHKEG
jgi:hypothetical protein